MTGLWQVKSDHDSLRGLNLFLAYSGLTLWAKLCPHSGLDCGCCRLWWCGRWIAYFLTDGAAGLRSAGQPGALSQRDPSSAFVDGPCHLPLRWHGPHDPAPRSVQKRRTHPPHYCGFLPVRRHPETWSGWITWLAGSSARTNRR